MSDLSVERPTEEELAILCARTADDNRAKDIVVMDMRRAMPLCDFFVVATGTSQRQMQAVANAIVKEIRPFRMRPLGREGYGGESGWILLDLGAVVVHVFDSEAREYYDLELLWGDAERLDWQRDEPPAGDAQD